MNVLDPEHTFGLYDSSILFYCSEKSWSSLHFKDLEIRLVFAKVIHQRDNALYPTSVYIKMQCSTAVERLTRCGFTLLLGGHGLSLSWISGTDSGSQMLQTCRMTDRRPVNHCSEMPMHPDISPKSQRCSNKYLKWGQFSLVHYLSKTL